ncbi:hypothetical protein VXE65_20725 [Mycolicibacterium conceptionense]|uniref:hypothetical protein n=1 Tax=Mycolicibacterium conceptionense TaxID=451644 RepID=UPI003204876B
MSVRYEGEPMSYEQWLEAADVPSSPGVAEAYRLYLGRHEKDRDPHVAPGLTPIPPPYDMRNDSRFRDDGTFYLIRYHGRWYTGTVERQHYGWNFDAVYSAGLQMNSGIVAIYEIEGKATRDAPIFEISADAMATASADDE